eukprot:1090125-Pelagomonas_calceolata.AAC.1
MSYHAIQRLKTIINTRHALRFLGTSGGGVAGRVAVESRRRRAWASRSMAITLQIPISSVLAFS